MSKRKPTTTLLCPRCKLREKHQTKNGHRYPYCQECQKAYIQSQRESGKLRAYNEPAFGNRKKLNITDTLEPSDPNSVPLIGYQIDRHMSSSYARNQRSSSDDWNHAYVIGHEAVQRFWHRTASSAWAMGPDLEIVLDGQATMLDIRIRKRFWHYRGGGSSFKRKG
jgi:hypothetical protein